MTRLHRKYTLKIYHSTSFNLYAYTFFLQNFSIVFFWRSCGLIEKSCLKSYAKIQLGRKIRLNLKEERQIATQSGFFVNVIDGYPFSVRRSVGHHFSRALSASTFSKLILKYRKNSSFLFWPIWLDLGNPALTQSTVATQNGARKLWNSKKNMRKPSKWSLFVAVRTGMLQRCGIKEVIVIESRHIDSQWSKDWPLICTRQNLYLSSC